MVTHYPVGDVVATCREESSHGEKVFNSPLHLLIGVCDEKGGYGLSDDLQTAGGGASLAVFQESVPIARIPGGSRINVA
jgi:hypothetical protein